MQCWIITRLIEEDAVLVISDQTLRRLKNYRRVMEQREAEANRRQWMVMTLDVMKEYEKVREEARAVTAAAGYASYLHGVQQGERKECYLYGEPMLHNTLVHLMENLEIRPVEA